MSAVSSADYSSFDSDFARTISQRFEHGRFLVIGSNSRELESQFAEARREADVWSPDELASKLTQDTGKARFQTAVWFYPSPEHEDDTVAEALSAGVDTIVLVPGPGADPAKRRPELVQRFTRLGFVPDYECDLMDLHPGAVCLRHLPGQAVSERVPAIEMAFARLNSKLGALRRTLEIRGSELEGAQRHIASLEQKLLKLKEYRRELRLLKEQKQKLRKSPERRLGQVFLAPYRLPQKLAQTVWKKLGRKRGKPTFAAPTEYQKWFERHRARAQDLKRMRDEARAFALRPLISVITPVFDTPVQRLEEAVESVLAQAYENWELVLVDDGSTATELLRMLQSIAARDQRIVLASLGKHGGISAASNQGLVLARGEWVTFLDHDDVLEPDALFQVLKALQTHPDVELIYSDEDKLADDGFEAPVFKPDWSPDFFLSYNYLGHLTAVRRDVVEKAGGFRSEFDSAQDYDLFFRIVERTNRIHHIPRVLYHWRRSESSSAISVRQKPGQLEASRLAVEEHLKRRGEPAHVAVDWRTHAFCVRRELLEPKRISVIIRSRHGGAERLTRCVETLTAQTSYPNYEIVIVQADKKFPEAAARFSHRLLYLSDAADDSTAKNQAVEQTESPWLLFLHDSIEVIEPDWITIMAEHVQRPEVGAVGARLLNSSEAVEHAGIVVGIDSIAQPAFRGFPAEHAGAANRQLQLTRNCSAVSSACMLTRREIFQEVGGFDANLSGALGDVDLCLKIRRAGYLIVYTPFARLYWHDAPGKMDTTGQEIMEQRWTGVLHGDPYYNPNLSRERADFSLGK
ncbi:MAG: glycosyltransferase [Candidatus Udaeobacter sp.]